jgi:ankyrin repeat protein
LDETYERVLNEIVTANRYQAYYLLQCLTVASRPLRVEELAEILALDFDGSKAEIPKLRKDRRWNDQEEALLSMCSSLVTVVDDNGDRVVQFSHFSVKEFLTSDRLAASVADVSYFHIPPKPAHTVIAKACLGILLHSHSDKSRGDAKFKAKSNSPLTYYAAGHWMDHARFEDVSTQIPLGMQRLFDPRNPYFEAWHKLYSPKHHFADSAISIPSPLYYASLWGFRDLAAHLVDKRTLLVNTRHHNPLAAALDGRHFDIAELLYQRGADVDIRLNDNRILLHDAIVAGSVDVAYWLLAHGADANSRDDNHETPLHPAVKYRRIEFVRMLLMRGIIVNAEDKANRIPLHLASEHLHVEIVRLLLQHGASAAAQDQKHSTPLHLALSWVSVKTA